MELENEESEDVPDREERSEMNVDTIEETPRKPAVRSSILLPGLGTPQEMPKVKILTSKLNTLS